ncbi:MAG: NAD(+) synthase, partial [Eubacteriales bacterium]|nr:NAD(+) synthase [Eubacteriales bacterium]
AENKNVVYENAQARIRADILFNVANAENAFVIGTGDLSEAALGWCTFGGDDLAHYNPNASVPKTLVRELVRHIASVRGGDLGKVLSDIAETPISPELVAGQETEKIVGKYELIDFIMFFFGKRHAGYSDIKNLCLAVFEELDEDEIVETLDRFYDRFKKTRFKRSSLSEGANLLGFSLPYFPDDIDYELI